MQGLCLSFSNDNWELYVPGPTDILLTYSHIKCLYSYRVKSFGPAELGHGNTPQIFTSLGI